MLLYRIAPKTVHHPEFEHKILESSENVADREKRIKRIKAVVKNFEDAINESGTGNEWILADIPEKDISFTASREKLMKSKQEGPLNLLRDPVKIVGKRSGVKLLVEMENSIIRRLSSSINFVPSVYANESAMKLFKEKKLI